MLSSFPAPPFVPGTGSGVDKLYHVLEFAVLGALATAAIGPVRVRGRSRAPWLGFALAGAYGILDEFHQLFVPARTGDAWDAAADLVGAAIGASLAWIAAGRRTFADPSPRP